MEENCFAYWSYNKKNTNGKNKKVECCLALETKDCINCPFYKHKDLVTDPMTKYLLEKEKKQILKDNK